MPISTSQLGFQARTKAAPTPDYNLFQPRDDLAPFAVTLPVAWNADPFKDRNWCAQLHMFRMTDGHLLAFESTGDAGFLRWPLELLLDWQQFHIVDANQNKFAWADKVTGHRAAALAFILAAAQTRQGIASHEEQQRLLELAEEHARQIMHVIPVRLSNHTFDDLVGVRALAEVLPDTHRPEILAFVKATFEALIDSQFTPDGLHKENSPGYQGYASGKLRQLMAAGWFNEYRDIEGLFHKSQEILRWFRTPDDKILMVGDTNGHVSGRPSPDAPSETGLFRVGGYVIQRDRTAASTPVASQAEGPDQAEPAPPSAYFVMMGSADSLVHKHNDDLSYTWYDGTEIVRETGKFAYKNDPMREFALSARAHNTIELDGCNAWPSYKEPYPAYGCAIRHVEQRDGCTLISALVRHTRLGISHARTILYRPGGFVLTADVVKDIAVRRAKGAPRVSQASTPVEGATRTLTQWTHFATNIKLKRRDSGIYAAALPGGRKLAVALAANDASAATELIRGQTEPRIQGWTSTAYAEMQPNDALGLTHQHSGTTRLGSLVAIDGRIRKLVWTSNQRLRTILGDDIITLTPFDGRSEASWRIDPKP